MDFTTFKGGPRAEFATLTGGGKGVTYSSIGPRQQVLPNSNNSQVFLQQLAKKPSLPAMIVDPFHGDIGVRRNKGRLNLSQLQEPYRRAFRDLMKDARDGYPDVIQNLMDRARKRMGRDNPMVFLTFAQISVCPDESPDRRMGRMVKRALGQLMAQHRGQPESSLEFPSDQKKGVWPPSTTRGL